MKKVKLEKPKVVAPKVELEKVAPLVAGPGKLIINDSTRSQAKFITSFKFHMKDKGEWYMGGTWGASALAEKLQRNPNGPDMCMPSTLTDDVIHYLLDYGYRVNMPTKNKLVAENSDSSVKAYIVFMDYEEGNYIFSTEKFYKNVEVPVKFFRQHEGHVPEFKMRFPTLTPALMVASKMAYKDNMRDKDRSDIREIEKAIEKDPEQKAVYEKEKKELLDILYSEDSKTETYEEDFSEEE